MDFELNDEQRLLSESITRFVADRYDFETRLRAMKQPDGWSRDIWRELAELGVLAMPFAEEDGGFGGGGVETMLVMEALGRGLLVEPYLATVVLAGGALRRAGSDTQRAAHIPAIATGERLMALAHSEPGLPRHTPDVRVKAQRTDSGWVLEGTKIAVLHGDCAEFLVVSALTDEGVSLFLVDAATSGVHVSAATGYDGVRVATIRFDGAVLPDDAIMGQPGTGSAILAAVFEEANAALAAEAVGVMAETFDITLDYLKTRQQFGVPIGSFQALQHRSVDMFIQLEMIRSMATLAALSLDAEPGQRARNIAAAKVQAGRSGRFIGQQAVQLHGAIGITSEYKVGHAFKRLTAIDALFGDADHHIDWLANAGGVQA